MFEKRNSFSFVAEMSPEAEKMMYLSFEGELPVLPLRDNVLFPGTINPVNVSRPFSARTVRRLEEGEGVVAVLTQRDSSEDSPAGDGLYPYGVACKLVHSMRQGDGNYTVLLQALNRVEALEVRPSETGYEGTFRAAADQRPAKEQRQAFAALLAMMREGALELISQAKGYPDELAGYIKGLKPTPFMMNVICTLMPGDIGQKYSLLAAQSEMGRAEEAVRALNNMRELLSLKRRIEQKTQADLDKQQREYFLSQELRNIQSELSGKDETSMREDDAEALRAAAKKKKWGKDTAQAFAKELAKLERINTQSPDYNVQLAYLQTLTQLPWDEVTRDRASLRSAERALERDHYGMEKVKERILEHLAVLKMRDDQKSPILCLYGPPGVGKTSLGRSVARALGRKYARVSLGGVHDESEIRGHRRTYVGAMPGRVVKALQRAGSSNPVFILDEIDKVSGATLNGDPSSALLEVLDPEQNNAFHDNYLDLDYDLSRVLFIATANDAGAIPRPLLDRMELIEVGGYITEEKIEIARRHLVPKKREANGLGAYKRLRVTRQALELIIERYTRESGVRALEKQIDKLFRKLALRAAKGELEDGLAVGPAEAEALLGRAPYSRDKYQGNAQAGVVTGLAWTSAGGEILFIETSLSPGKGGKLTLTGNLGDVMKESAVLALEYTKAHAGRLGIDPRVFDRYNIHIHVPEGAVPKDGPSAGIAMATSIASALTQRKVRARLAMTGEITLRGKVLPVGGVKEKILAAKRAGVTDVLLCRENQRDIEEIPDMYLKGLAFHYVDTVGEVWDLALLGEKVDDALEFRLDDAPEEREA